MIKKESLVTIGKGKHTIKNYKSIDTYPSSLS